MTDEQFKAWRTNAKLLDLQLQGISDYLWAISGLLSIIAGAAVVSALW